MGVLDKFLDIMKLSDEDDDYDNDDFFDDEYDDDYDDRPAKKAVFFHDLKGKTMMIIMMMTTMIMMTERLDLHPEIPRVLPTL